METARIELREANEFVAKLHRHHKPVRGHRFSFGAAVRGVLVGVAICGRPVARGCDQKHVLEVLRCCTDGTSNVCSFLYSKAVRVARELGFRRVQTYILRSESGVSLEASGFVRGHETDGGTWNCDVRKGRREDQPQEPKVCYYRELN